MCKKRLFGVKQNNLLKLGLWLGAKQNQPWVRGINDCCTLFLEYHDHMTGESQLDTFKGKYNDLKSAIRWARKFPKVHEWFPAHGYVQVKIPLDGDIVMVHNHRYFPSSYIVCNGYAWGIMDEATRMTRHELEAPTVEYSIWRYKHGS